MQTYECDYCGAQFDSTDDIAGEFHNGCEGQMFAITEETEEEEWC